MGRDEGGYSSRRRQGGTVVGAHSLRVAGAGRPPGFTARGCARPARTAPPSRSYSGPWRRPRAVRQAPLQYCIGGVRGGQGWRREREAIAAGTTSQAPPGARVPHARMPHTPRMPAHCRRTRQDFGGLSQAQALDHQVGGRQARHPRALLLQGRVAAGTRGADCGREVMPLPRRLPSRPAACGTSTSARPHPPPARTWLSPLAPWSRPLIQSPARNRFWKEVSCVGRHRADPGLKCVTARGKRSTAASTTWPGGRREGRRGVSMAKHVAMQAAQRRSQHSQCEAWAPADTSPGGARPHPAHLCVPEGGLALGHVGLRAPDDLLVCVRGSAGRYCGAVLRVRRRRPAAMRCSGAGDVRQGCVCWCRLQPAPPCPLRCPPPRTGQRQQARGAVIVGRNDGAGLRLVLVLCGCGVVRRGGRRFEEGWWWHGKDREVDRRAV